MQSKMAIQDIFNRNGHHNYFQIKIPSHNASKQHIQNITYGYILNKLALIPFQQHVKFAQLYKYSLQQLISLPQEYFQNEAFVDNLTEHLCTWQEKMGRFGTWPYTRGAFYSIQQKIKKNQDLLERIILKRAYLQPNKQEFISKSFSQTFKNKELIKFRKYYQNKQLEQIIEQKKYNLPSDLLFQDSDECWSQLYKNYQLFDKEEVVEYLRQYRISGLQRFLNRRINDRQENIIKSLQLRNKVYSKFEGETLKLITKWIECFQQKKATSQVFACQKG